ncbi:50S ribosomal protein L9 [Ichthyobacterium seriolicida]|uniref:Large ribosomal subunit protein bL9 n=1 Tax=Ichthyobacterium seriolicida TaxID=242600 RepID=A0A1J1DZS5_9FLAO|nr:50S ribosomal protein L9 [Ichthyobacterium seriolicida]BAV94181.1 50S ribosomal protein L9 [Ichthyobacterium seriolicida]
MEVILKTDVEKLGFKDDLVSVKPGYARNFLIPKKFAVLASPSAKKMLEETLKQRRFKESKIVEAAREMANKAKDLDIKISAKVSKLGKLFGSISSAELSSALSKEGVDLDKKFVQIFGSGLIKTVGKYEAKLRFHRDVIVDISFEVLAEK